MAKNIGEKNKRKADILLKRAIKKNAKFLVGILFLSAVSAVTSALLPIFNQKIIDVAIPQKDMRLV